MNGFSCVNHNNIKSRSRLQNESLMGILYDKNLLKREKCFKYKIDKKCIKHVMLTCMIKKLIKLFNA